MTYHQKDNVWELPTPEEAEDCSFCENRKKPRFVLTPKVMAVCRKLCDDIKVEWQMLLIGEETDNGIFCYDYFIPKQEVGVASVKNIDEIDLAFVTKKKIVGGIHSHGDIAVGWSHTDDQCTNYSFIKHNIVTNNKGDFLAKSRIELPCGMIRFQNAKVVVKVPEVKNIKGVDNIEKKIYKPYAKPSNTDPTGTTHHLPTYYKGDTEGITWRYGDKRQHGFMYDQDHEGGQCGF